MAKLRIYLAGAEGFAPACRQVRGKNFGLLVSFFTCSVKNLNKMVKILRHP